MKQVHPIPPLYNENSKILILGSFPSVKSREENFFYSHPQNRFWKVISGVFQCETPDSIEKKKKVILSNGLALWDVIGQCEITGSSDASIKDVKANNLEIILSECDIRQIFVNGKAAEKYYVKYIEKSVDKKAVCLPSTSPANAAWNLDRLIEAWSVIKEYK